MVDATAVGNNGRKTASLMISYSRKDKVFVKQLYEGLVARGFSPDDIWVDWEGIPFSADWKAEITKGIQSANAFVFVISPDSILSDVCKQEIEIAAESNKRFIPIMHRELDRGTELHAKISSHNWIFIRDKQELEDALPDLIEAINTDLAWLAEHTRLFNRAKEWESKGRNDSYLVRGNDLSEAVNFIANGAAGKEPAPTALHIEYVQAARKYTAVIRQRNRIVAALIGIVLAALSVIASIQAARATNNQHLAETQEAFAQAKATEANEQRATAQANAEEARKQQSLAEMNAEIASRNARRANAQALAAASINQRDNDTQLGLMLALLAIQETEQDKEVLPEARSALFASLNVPNVLYTWNSPGDIVFSVAFDPTGSYVATGSMGGVVTVLDIESRQLVRKMELGNRIYGLDFSPDGKRLGITSEQTALVWDVENDQVLFQLAGHGRSRIADLDFSPDGKLIATAGWDKNVKLWYADTGALKVTLGGHQNAVTAVDFSPDSQQLISGSYDKTAILWSVETSALVRTIRTDDWVLSVAFGLPSGDRVMTSSNAAAAVWNVKDGSLIHNLYGNYSWVWDVDFAPDGLTVLTASTAVKIWDFYHGLERFNLSSHVGEVFSAAYSPDGKYILTSSIDQTVKLWSANLRIETLRLNKHNSPYLDAKYSLDGKRLVLANSLGYADMYDAQTGELIDSFAGTRAADINATAFDPQDSQRIVTGDNLGGVAVWIEGNKKSVLQIPAHSARVNSVIFSPDGSMILTAGDDNTARLWDSQTGTLVHEFPHENFVRDARFSDDGKRIVTASADNTAKLWDGHTYENLLVIKGHTDFVDAAIFSHDGSRLYTASDDNTIIVWDAQTGAPLQTLFGHTGHVVDLDLSPDGTLLVSGSADTTVKVWDLATGKELYTFLGNNESTNSVRFSTDGKRILTASSDNTTKEFIIDYNELLEVAQDYELRPLTPEDCQRFLNGESCDLRLLDFAASR